MIFMFLWCQKKSYLRMKVNWGKFANECLLLLVFSHSSVLATMCSHTDERPFPLIRLTSKWEKLLSPQVKMNTPGVFIYLLHSQSRAAPGAEETLSKHWPRD